jgi:hypothetical protein
LDSPRIGFEREFLTAAPTPLLGESPGRTCASPGPPQRHTQAETTINDRLRRVLTSQPSRMAELCSTEVPDIWSEAA